MRLSSDRWTLSSECGIAYILYSGQRFRHNNIIRINRGRRYCVHIINFYRMI